MAARLEQKRQVTQEIDARFGGSTDAVQGRERERKRVSRRDLIVRMRPCVRARKSLLVDPYSPLVVAVILRRRLVDACDKSPDLSFYFGS